jgi:hypothetical protein
VCQGSDGNKVDTRPAYFGNGLLGDAAAGLGSVAAINQGHRFAELRGLHVVEHNAVYPAGIQHLLHFIQRAGFHFNRQLPAGFLQVGMGSRNGLGNTASVIHMVVLQDNHVEQAVAVVYAPPG